MLGFQWYAFYVIFRRKTQISHLLITSLLLAYYLEFSIIKVVSRNEPLHILRLFGAAKKR